MDFSGKIHQIAAHFQRGCKTISHQMANPNPLYAILNSKTRARDFPDFGKVDYDVHVFFNTDTREVVDQFRLKMKADFADKHIFVGEMIDGPVGPFSEPMWEANLQRDMFLEVVEWLMRNRGDIVVLVHSLTGDNYWDHTQGALHMGGMAPLNANFFKK